MKRVKEVHAPLTEVLYISRHDVKSINERGSRNLLVQNIFVSWLAQLCPYLRLFKVKRKDALFVFIKQLDQPRLKLRGLLLFPTIAN